MWICYGENTLDLGEDLNHLYPGKVHYLDDFTHRIFLPIAFLTTKC